MRIRWRGFELPSTVTCEKESLTSTYGKFVAEPFERGFGTTIGNSIRRALLSSIEGAAVTAVNEKARVDNAEILRKGRENIVMAATILGLSAAEIDQRMSVFGPDWRQRLGMPVQPPAPPAPASRWGR